MFPASAGTIPRSTPQDRRAPPETRPQAAAGTGWSKHWRTIESRCFNRRSERYAAFLQNALITALPYPGFHPGLVCRAPLGHLKGVAVRPRAAHENRAERCQARASLGGEHPTPSRKARKLILPRAYSANGGLMPRSPAHQNPSGAVSGRSEPWRRTPQPPRAQRESSSSSEPPQRAEA